MGKYIWITFWIAIITFFIFQYIEKSEKDEANRIQREEHQLNIKNKISDLLKKTNANYQWNKELAKGESFRLEPILTIELEKVWITKTPISFKGRIKDITTENNESYIVDFKQSIMTEYNLFNTDLELRMTAPKSIIDRLLEKYPTLLTENQYDDNIIVIAKITSIEKKYIQSDDNVVKDVKVGIGEILDIMYIGE